MNRGAYRYRNGATFRGRWYGAQDDDAYDEATGPPSPHAGNRRRWIDLDPDLEAVLIRVAALQVSALRARRSPPRPLYRNAHRMAAR